MTALEARFWAKVQKSDSCWLWTGAKAGRGVWSTLPQRIPALLVGFGGGIAAAIGLYGWVTWVTRP